MSGGQLYPSVVRQSITSGYLMYASYLPFLYLFLYNDRRRINYILDDYRPHHAP